MSYDRDQFRDSVKARVDLAAWILREGIPLKGTGHEWKACCPFHNEKSPSFTVFHKEGHWGFHCFGCGAGGDIFEWVMRRKSLDFVQALKLVAHEVGLAMPEPEKRLYQPPEVRAALAPKERGPFDPDAYQKIDPAGKVAAYLTGRGLPLDLLARYNVGQTADGEAYAFAYKWQPPQAKHARFEFCKVVQLARPEGKKIERRDPKGGRNILFGMLAVPAEATRLVIAEGEIDALTWAHCAAQAGMVLGAVSVPGGAGYLGWIDVCWDWLQRFKQIHISFDEDRAGRAKVVEVVQRLGIERTDMVRLPVRMEDDDDDEKLCRAAGGESGAQQQETK